MGGGGGFSAVAPGGVLPPNAVIAFNLSSCPAGWTEVTDLAGRFIVGTGTLGSDTYNFGDEGGEARHALTTAELAAHDHSVDPPSTSTNNDGAHNHTYNHKAEEASVSTGGGNRWNNNSTATTSTNGNHSHTVDIAPSNSGSTGNGDAHENRPPYKAYVFCESPDAGVGGGGGGGGSGGSTVSTGMIAAFEMAACPSGWAEYEAARGRFLRGIDNGAGNDPSGTRAAGDVQSDDFTAHSHVVVNGNDKAVTINDTSTEAAADHVAAGVSEFLEDRRQLGSPKSRIYTDSQGGSETRPKNVAVIFCQYEGSDPATLLAALLDTDVGGAADGSCLTFNGGVGKWEDDGCDPGLGTLTEDKWCKVTGGVVDCTQDAPSGTPSGAVMSFDLASCPTGWSEYTPARGRFVRGIDNGAGNDPDGTRAPGNVQGDAIRNITGSVNARTVFISNIFGGASGVFSSTHISGPATGGTGGAASAGTDNLTFDASNQVPTAAENRPRNVALLYCRKD